jgi:predicted RNase H-like HicB family nuclease
MSESEPTHIEQLKAMGSTPDAFKARVNSAKVLRGSIRVIESMIREIEEFPVQYNAVIAREDESAGPFCACAETKDPHPCPTCKRPKRCYTATFPDLVYCGAFALTEDECRKEAQHELELWIETQLDDHEEVPPPTFEGGTPITIDLALGYRLTGTWIPRRVRSVGP